MDSLSEQDFSDMDRNLFMLKMASDVCGILYL